MGAEFQSETLKRSRVDSGGGYTSVSIHNATRFEIEKMAHFICILPQF